MEVYSNLVSNPSAETGNGTHGYPTGWATALLVGPGFYPKRLILIPEHLPLYIEMVLKWNVEGCGLFRGEICARILLNRRISDFPGVIWVGIMELQPQHTAGSYYDFHFSQTTWEHRKYVARIRSSTSNHNFFTIRMGSFIDDFILYSLTDVSSPSLQQALPTVPKAVGLE